MTVRSPGRGVTRRRALATALAGGALAGAVRAVRAQDVASADIAAYRGPDRQERLIEGARREGGVTIYSSMPVDDMRAQTAAFERRSGIAVRVWRASGEAVLQRAIAESRAGRHEADILEATGADLEAMIRENLLRPAHSPARAAIHERALPAHGGYVGTRFLVEALLFNTALVARADLPRRWEDLSDPRWRGRLAIANDSAVWFSAMAGALGLERAQQIFGDAFATNGVSVRQGHSLLANLVVAGEVPLALTVYDYRAEQLKRSGAPVDYFYLDPTPVGLAGIGLSRRAPHPHAAMLFYDFALSDGLTILNGRGFRTTTGAGALPAGVRAAMIDGADFAANGTLWQQRFRSIVGRPPQ